ncbi:MAG: 7-carboxy-7-deazaguanine synthase QueE [Magnetococcales bacterium]|nr:7-carboxy-7-deazaguanine synthase QueE [Magnetococcales bacterium]
MLKAPFHPLSGLIDPMDSSTPKAATLFPLCDLFVSIQGEGRWSGRPMIFLRFWGCPLACSWCDEPRHKDPQTRQDLSLDELLIALDQIAPSLPSVLLTGGEPLGVDHLPVLIDALKKRGKWLAMESSGIGGEIPEGLDWLTISPKKALPAEIMEASDELKFIVGPNPSASQQQEIDRWAARHPNVWLQPRADGDQPNAAATATALQWVLASEGRLQLSVQQHKYLNIP